MNNVKIPEIKSCSKCGNRSGQWDNSKGENTFSIKCRFCDYATKWYPMPLDAIKAWDDGKVFHPADAQQPDEGIPTLNQQRKTLAKAEKLDVIMGKIKKTIVKAMNNESLHYVQITINLSQGGIGDIKSRTEGGLEE